jgi:hypothetical protein
VLMDLLWSDPTTNDGVQGVQPSPRGPGLVTFGPDRVKDFCKVRGALVAGTYRYKLHAGRALLICAWLAMSGPDRVQDLCKGWWLLVGCWSAYSSLLGLACCLTCLCMLSDLSLHAVLLGLAC